MSACGFPYCGGNSPECRTCGQAAADPVARHLAAGIADRWRDECLRLRAYANAAHWWAEAQDKELAEAGDTRFDARSRMIDAEAALLLAGHVFGGPNVLVTGDQRP